MGCHFFLQGISPTLVSNLRLLHWQVNSLLLRHQGPDLNVGSAIIYLGDLEATQLSKFQFGYLLIHWKFTLYSKQGFIAKSKLYMCVCLVAQLCLTLCDRMDCSIPGFPVLHRLLEFAQTRVH